MKLNDIGIIVDRIYKNIPIKFNNILLDEYVIMPNHLHGIIEIINIENIENRVDARPAPTIGDVISYFKSKTVCECIKNLNNYMQFNQLWQRNYYEHIIRNEKELYKIIEYIRYNPLNWETDSSYKM